MKLIFQKEIINSFITFLNIEINEQIINKICTFGYEINSDNNYYIMFPVDESVLSPIVLIYIFYHFKKYTHNIISSDKYLQLEYDNKEFLLREFGDTKIPYYLQPVIQFYKNTGKNIVTKEINEQYIFNKTIIRRLRLSYTENNNNITYKITKENDNNNILELINLLNNKGYYEIILEHILNNKDIKFTYDYKQSHIIEKFNNRNYIRNWLIQAYDTEFNKYYFKLIEVFTVDTVYNIDNETDDNNILIVTKNYYLHNKIKCYTDIIKDIIGFFGKRFNLYILPTDHTNKYYEIKHKNNIIGICGQYLSRIFVELRYSQIIQLSDNKITKIFHDYNITASYTDLLLIISKICSLNNVINYSVLDIYYDNKQQKKYKFTLRVMFSEITDYELIEQIINVI